MFYIPTGNVLFLKGNVLYSNRKMLFYFPTGKCFFILKRKFFFIFKQENKKMQISAQPILESFDKKTV